MGRIPVLGLLVLTGCGPPWDVLRQSGPPSALRGAQNVVVAIDYGQMSVRGEPLQVLMGRLDPEEQAKLQGGLQALDQAFKQELALSLSIPVLVAQGPPLPGEVRLTLRYLDVVLGKYAVVVAQDTLVHADLLWSVGPQLTDQVQTRVQVGSTIRQPSRVQRLSIAARVVAQRAAYFLETEQTR